MKVQTRLSLYSSLVFGVIFLILSLLIYGLYYNRTRKSLYENLRKNAYISAFFYLEEDELNFEEFEKIRSQFEEFVPDSSYQIYNEHNQLSYGLPVHQISDPWLERIRREEAVSFEWEDYLCHGIFYEDNQGDFVVVVFEKAQVLQDQVKPLVWILALAFGMGLVTFALLSKWVAGMAYRPFSTVIRQVRDISTHDLGVQIASPGTKDELQDLTETFNDLLVRIADTVTIQKNFVRYVSHEFKTPLAALLGNLEVFSIKERTPEEYRRLCRTMIAQVRQMEETLDTLIVVSDLRKAADMTTAVRIDELIWEISRKLQEIYPQARVAIHIDIPPEDEQLMAVPHDPSQLLTALYNLTENAVKFSRGKPVDIHIGKEEDKLCLSIADKGIGIPEEQLRFISRPFYRAENTGQIQGSGIGLSIALRILEKNRINYRIESDPQTGTVVYLLFG